MINKSPDEIRWLMNYTPEHRLWGPNLFTPMDRERWNQRRTRSIRRSISRYHLENGWREVVTISTNPEKTIPKYLHTLSTCFDMTKCDISKSLSETLEKTRDWSSRGVMVFGVEPPTDPRIKKLEEKLSGYDSAHVHELFREAGGIFIQITGNYPSTLDGSHLASEEAKAFSREVAQAIAAQCTLQHQ